MRTDRLVSTSVDALARDVRYAARGLLRSPGFAALTVLCLALGIGVNSAVFSIADNVSLRPLPFDEPDRLVALYSTQPSAGINTARASYLDFRDWKEQARSYADLGAYSYRSLSITDGVESERFQAAAVTSNLFALLGVQPIVGRPFTPDDDRAGARPVVMLSHGLWQRRYAGDSSIVGRRARNRLRNTLVVVEVALSLMLLVGASLFVRSFLNIQNADAGLDTAPLMTLRMLMPEGRYQTAEAMTARANDVVRRVEALPGVAAAFASNLVPLAGGGGTAAIVAEGPAVEAGKEPRANFFATAGHVVETLGQTVLSGRDFTDAEAATRSGTALVNEAMARRMWPGRSDIVGRRFRFAADPADEWHTVIGVVSDFQPLILRDKTIVEPLAILPYPYHALPDTGLTIRVTGIPPASITPAVRNAIGQSDPLLAVFDARTGDENREGRSWSSLLLSWMFSIFGAAALFLAGIGIYGVLSYSVAQRTQEFGVRVALGATRRSILALVVAQGGRLAAVGIVLGSAGAFMVTRLVRALLYNVTPTDPVSFGGMALVLAAVTVLAGCVPAGRATSVDPILALRAD